MQRFRDCPRLGYLSEHANGTGLQPIGEALELATGIYLHDRLAGLRRHDILPQWEGVRQAIGLAYADSDPDALEREHWWLLEGLVEAWVRVRMPNEFSLYESVSTEDEIIVELGSGVYDALRCDWLKRRRSDGGLFYHEFKSARDPNGRWQRQWDTSLQVLLNIGALERALHERIEGVFVEALKKGERKWDDEKMRPVLQSPLVYTYTKDSKISWKYRAGWAKTPTSEVYESPLAMIQAADPDDLESLFELVGPLRPIPEHVERAVQGVVRQEWSVQARLGGHPSDSDFPLDSLFPVHEDTCQRYPNPCPFMPICFGGLQDPLDNGFMPRVPHHLTEIP